MKQDNRNSISVIQRNLDEALRVNPIEDGNTPLNDPNQGYMYTSEINDPDYTDAYKFIVNSIFSNKTKTGNNNYYQITVTYEVTDNGAYGGLFGNNLIKVGDTFVLKDDLMQDFNWVKGSVIAITNVSLNSTNAPIIEYTYTLSCAISEGLTNRLPQGVLAAGDVMFYTDRRVFVEKDDRAPINLLSSIKNGKVLFSWDDPTNKAVKYNFTFRLEDNSYNNGITTICGNSYNFNGNVQAKLNSLGAIQYVKIIDPGKDIAWQFEIPNVITSTLGVTPPVITFYNDSCGSLGIKECQIVEVTAVNASTVTCKFKDISTFMFGSGGAFWPRVYVDLYQNKNLGDQTWLDVINGSVGEYYDVNIKWDSSFSYNSLSDAQADLVGKRFKAHTGVYVVSAGLNMNKEPKIFCDKYIENTKNVIDAGNFPTPGTYYWKVASIFDCNEKSYTEWSQEVKLIIP